MWLVFINEIIYKAVIRLLEAEGYWSSLCITFPYKISGKGSIVFVSWIRVWDYCYVLWPLHALWKSKVAY